MSNSIHFVEIFKPLYSTDEGDTCGVYDKHIKDAIRDRKMIHIKSKHGEKVFFPKWIKKNCPVIEAVYLRPDEPMRLYKVFIPRKKKQTEDEKTAEMCRDYYL